MKTEQRPFAEPRLSGLLVSVKTLVEWLNSPIDNSPKIHQYSINVNIPKDLVYYPSYQSSERIQTKGNNHYKVFHHRRLGKR